MNRVAKPLREMGAVIETGPEGRPPMTIRGGQRLTGMHYDMPMASAQVKSCLLLAGLYAAGETSVTEPAPTRDHTERMLRGFGYPVEVEGSTAKVESGHKLSATHIEVPTDISSAASSWLPPVSPKVRNWSCSTSASTRRASASSRSCA